MKLLTPEKVLQAVKDNKPVEYSEDNCEYWSLLKPRQWDLNDLLSNRYTFRLKQEIITVGDVSFPKPEIQTPEIGTKYYTPILCTIQPFDYHTWEDTQIDYEYFKMNLIHLSKENAIAHAKALIKLSGGTYE